MRTKRRQTNIQILNRNLEDLALHEQPLTDGHRPLGVLRTLIVPTKIKEIKPATAELKMIEKPKKGRGAPKAALINTAKLLTG